MYWILRYTDEDKKVWIYVCKAETLWRACSIAGLDENTVTHCVITKDIIDHLENIDGGYVRIKF